MSQLNQTEDQKKQEHLTVGDAVKQGFNDTGEIRCAKCKGLGRVYAAVDPDKHWRTLVWCPDCNGTGKPKG